MKKHFLFAHSHRLLLLGIIFLLGGCDNVIEPISSGPADGQLIAPALATDNFLDYRVNIHYENNSIFGQCQTDAYISTTGDMRFDIYKNALIGIGNSEYLQRSYYERTLEGYDLYTFSQQEEDNPLGLGYSYFANAISLDENDWNPLNLTLEQQDFFGYFNMNLLTADMFSYDEDSSGYYSLKSDYLTSLSSSFFHNVTANGATLLSMRLRVADDLLYSLTYTLLNSDESESTATLYFYFSNPPLTPPETPFITAISTFTVSTPEDEGTMPLAPGDYFSFTLLDDENNFLGPNALYTVGLVELYEINNSIGYDANSSISLFTHSDSAGISDRVFALPEPLENGKIYDLRIGIRAISSDIVTDYYQYSFEK